ncbi:uncharacterized protein LOC135131226 isoform X1 [Zophobas morio]|uniref:uncharacterized protein LOC135131226 isoform X1 n=1 Tax=Zophobas morio TaxID=2755281 RepID=UPI003083D917
MFCNKPSLINVSCTLKQSQIGALYTKSVKQIEATVKENLTQRNEELCDVLQIGRSSLVSTARQNLVEKSLPILGRMDGTLTQLSQNQVHRNVDIQTRLADATKNLEECYQGIQSTGRAGDTPARQTYKYPKGIPFCGRRVVASDTANRSNACGSLIRRFYPPVRELFGCCC